MVEMLKNNISNWQAYLLIFKDSYFEIIFIKTNLFNKVKNKTFRSHFQALNLAAKTAVRKNATHKESS
jgi:hypothetical protein